MLINSKDIYDAEPPFLILFANQQWKVASKLQPHNDGVGYVEPFSPDEDAMSGVIPGSPWHVGDNVWELDYATQIMTLDHPNLRKHPAWQLWLQWLQFKMAGDDYISH
ncbi:MAG: hypothetical protein PVG66_06265 [Chromatiales bacterium]|jgi:hypothetical protein